MRREKCRDFCRPSGCQVLLANASNEDLVDGQNPLSFQFIKELTIEKCTRFSPYKNLFGFTKRKVWDYFNATSLSKDTDYNST